MRKIYLSFVTVCLVVFSISCTAYSADLDKTKLAKNVAENMKTRGVDVSVNVDVIKKMEEPNGYYFVKLTFIDNKKKTGEKAGEQYIFTDGSFIVQDFLRVSDMGSIGKDLIFDASYKDIDVSSLSPLMGKKGAKNVVVEITDFQCPFCIKANEYLHKQLKNRDDVVVYIIHYPLEIHPKAELSAKIFEAGVLMGKNFSTDLYNDSITKMTDADIIEKFAKMSGNPTEFKKLLVSEEIKKKIADSKQLAAKLEVRSTPTLFFNGKMVVGFDETLMDSAIKNFK